MATKKKETNARYITRTLTLPSGKRKYVYGKTAAEADAKLAALKKELALGVNIEDDTTFGELAKVWLEQYKAPYLKASSVYTIRTMINAHAMPYLAARKVKDITGPIIRNWFSRVVATGYSKSSVLLGYTRSIFDLAVELNCIAKSPVPPTLRAPAGKSAKEKEVLPAEVEREILAALPAFSPERLFFQLGRYTGLRRGEIYALNWDSIDLDAGTLRVRRNLATDDDGRSYFADDTKTESGMREVPIPAALCTELATWRDRFGENSTAGLKIPVTFGTNGYLFCHPGGEPYTMQNLQTVWNRIRRQAQQIDPDYAEYFTPHVLRHTYITRLFERGLDIKEIQYLAGHSDVQTTLSIYTHFDKQSRRDATFDKVRGAMAEKSAPRLQAL